MYSLPLRLQASVSSNSNALNDTVQATRGALLISLSVCMVTGFWYRYVPHEWNWSVAQIALFLHLAAGVLALINLLVFVPLHLRVKNIPLRYSCLPGNPDSLSGKPERQASARSGRLFHLLILAVFLTGVWLILPVWSFYLGDPVMPGYLNYSSWAMAHVVFSMVFVPALIVHLSFPKKLNTPEDRA